jgi:hypothetical protein
MRDSVSQRDSLTKRLRYLWTWELFDSFFIPALALVTARVVQRSIDPFTIYSAGVVTWLLWQGAAYWRLKLRAVQTGSPIRGDQMRWFAVLKKVNWLLLAIGPILLGARLAAGYPFAVFDAMVGPTLYTLAVLEQINYYYYYQLMYDCPSDWQYLAQHRKLKRSNLSRTLKKFQG